jgi:uncharacterized RDD family membrane protein YckC
MSTPLDPRRREALGLPPLRGKAPDPRHIVTPDAFEVHPALLGIPLAGHGRRCAAILVDLFLVLLLTRAGGLLLGLLAAAFLLRIGFGGKREGEEGAKARAGSGLFRGAFGCAGALVLFVTVVAVWGIVSGSGDAGGFRGFGGYGPAMDGAGAAGGGGGGDPVGGIRALLRNFAEDLGLGFGWGALYFSAFTAWWKGKTPGKALMKLRVVRLDREPISLWTAFERYGGYAAGFATGLLGFAQVLWDANRQAIHDRIAGTVVIQDGAAPLPEPTRRLRYGPSEGEREP